MRRAQAQWAECARGKGLRSPLPLSGLNGSREAHEAHLKVRSDIGPETIARTWAQLALGARLGIRRIAAPSFECGACFKVLVAASSMRRPSPLETTALNAVVNAGLEIRLIAPINGGLSSALTVAGFAAAPASNGAARADQGAAAGVPRGLGLDQPSLLRAVQRLRGRGRLSNEERPEVARQAAAPFRSSRSSRSSARFPDRGVACDRGARRGQGLAAAAFQAQAHATGSTAAGLDSLGGLIVSGDLSELGREPSRCRLGLPRRHPATTGIIQRREGGGKREPYAQRQTVRWKVSHISHVER
jgi:hypothetical protein